MARKSRMSIEVSRRKFLVTGTAAGGGLALGLHVPGLTGALAQKVLGTEGDEVGAWVFIRPNDDVVIRIARTEMGQGTLTGLAQLVAEELECDWKRVKTEMPTPGQNLARNRIWGDMSTGGSRGIRGSHEYVRKGGAAARAMLIEAAAAEWKVPGAECKAEASVITPVLVSFTKTSAVPFLSPGTRSAAADWKAFIANTKAQVEIIRVIWRSWPRNTWTS